MASVSLRGGIWRTTFRIGESGQLIHPIHGPTHNENELVSDIQLCRGGVSKSISREIWLRISCNDVAPMDSSFACTFDTTNQIFGQFPHPFPTDVRPHTENGAASSLAGTWMGGRLLIISHHDPLRACGNLQIATDFAPCARNESTNSPVF